MKKIPKITSTTLGTGYPRYTAPPPEDTELLDDGTINELDDFGRVEWTSNPGLYCNIQDTEHVQMKHGPHTVKVFNLSEQKSLSAYNSLLAKLTVCDKWGNYLYQIVDQRTEFDSGSYFVLLQYRPIMYKIISPRKAKK